MFERLMNYERIPQTMLVQQYRMHEVIMKWSSKALYEGKLVKHPSVKNRVIDELLPLGFKVPNQLISKFLGHAVALVDTSEAKLYE